MKLLKAIRDFSYGIVDSFGRGKEPEGSFADAKNLVPKKIGSLRTVHGYGSTSLSSHVADVNLLPGGFPDAVGSGTTAVEQIVADPFCYSSEYPTPYDAKLFHVVDDDDAKHVMLDTWFKGSTSKVTDNSGFVFIDEKKKLEYSADITITGTSTRSIVVANASAKGLSATNDHYNGWRIEFYDDASGITKYSMVVDYAVVTDTATFSVHDDIGSDWTNWLTFAAGCHLYLRRWFHSIADRTVGWGTTPGQCYASEGRVRGCGGSGGVTSYEPYWVGYINRTFFPGTLHADTSTAAVAYQGTYVDDLEVTGNVITQLVGSDKILVVQYISDATFSGKDFVESAGYKLNYTFEYDGYQESTLYVGGGRASAGTNYLKFYVSIHLPSLSKRITAINLYAQQYLNGIWTENYFIRRVSFTANPTSCWRVRQADIPITGAHTIADLFTIDGVTTEFAEAQLTGPDWDGRGSTFFQRTGMVEPFDNSNNWVDERYIVSWDYVETLAGRMFYGNFYDPNSSEVISDYVRFTGFNNGVPSLDMIPSDRLNYEFEVSTGSPGAIVGLRADKGFIYIFKDDSIHSMYINESPETWVRSTISVRDGLYAPKSLVSLPDGGICFASADHYKMIYNQRIINLTEALKDTYYALSGKANIIAWYDKIDDAVCFTNGVDTTGRVHYRGYRNSNGFAWYKVVLPANHHPQYVGVDRVGDVYFTNNPVAGFQGFFKWGVAVHTFGGAAIIPYFKTNNIVLDESVHVLLDKVVVTKSGNADTGTLQTRVYVDGVLSQSWAAEDKTMETLYQKLSPLSARQGRRIQFEYNYHSSGESLSSDFIQLDGIDIYGMAIQPPEVSK